ncbi:MAG: LCP family protein [Oscillospiraceae bacterium]|nr:LCP family protein [Oscillospiraceae bacterium]
MAKEHSRVTENEKKRRKKQVKRNRLLAGLLAVAIVAGGAVFCFNKMFGNMFSSGEEISKDIRTAEDLQDKVINILVCGVDYTDGRTSANTDTMLYVTLDVEGKKVSALQIPRDTFIGDDVKTGGSKKVNAVYGHGDEKNQIMNLVKVINDKLGLPVDHYVTLDMDALIAMVDWIDWGFEMYVPYPVVLQDKNTGETNTLIAEPGWYQLGGEQVEVIVRNRNYPGGDTARLEVQNYFYASLVKNFMENLNVSDFIKVLPRFTQYITTDLSMARIASMAKFGFTVAYEDMALVKPAVYGYDVVFEGNTYKTNILVADKEDWANVLNTYFRPYQDPVSADELKLPGTPPAGEVAREYGRVSGSLRTIGDILSGAEPTE